MIKIVVCIALGLFASVRCGEPARPQPRLLFYDEEGNLVKTHSNPYLQNLRLNAGLPLYGSFLNPIFGFIKDFGSIFAFTVPVSNAVIQQIKKNPQYHNQLMIVPTKDPVIEPNPLCEGRRAQIPSPTMCNNYLNCWDGWAVEQECPKDLLFSSQGYCDYSDNVNCGSRRIKEQPPTQPQCRSDFETFRNPSDCNEFFVCVNREPVKFKCPADLAYSPRLGVCDFPGRVDCSASATTTGIFAVQATSPAPAAPPMIPAIPASPPMPAPETPSAVIPSVPAAPVNPPAVPPVPAVPVPPQPPASIPPVAPPQLPQSPTYPGGPVIPPMPLLPAAMKPEDIKTVYSENSIFNTQGWTSINIATSLQDAINQLQRKNFAKTEA